MAWVMIIVSYSFYISPITHERVLFSKNQNYQIAGETPVIEFFAFDYVF